MATHIADGTGSSVYPYSAMKVTSGAAAMQLYALESGTGGGLVPVLCTAGGALYFTSGAL